MTLKSQFAGRFKFTVSRPMDGYRGFRRASVRQGDFLPVSPVKGKFQANKEALPAC